VGALRRNNDLCPGETLGGPFGHGQRDQGAPEAEYGSESEQAGQVETDALFIKNPVDAEQPEDDAQNQDDGKVGDDKDQDTFHGRILLDSHRRRWHIRAQPGDRVPLRSS